MRTADTYQSLAFQVVQAKLSHPFHWQNLAKISPFLHQIYGTHFQSTMADTPAETVYIFFHSSQTVLSNCQLNCQALFVQVKKMKLMAAGVGQGQQLMKACLCWEK